MPTPDETHGDASHGTSDETYSPVRLGTIRWYINAIENEALQVFFAAPDAQLLDDVQSTLSAAMAQIHTIAVNMPRPKCPWGPPCLDGTCRPPGGCPDDPGYPDPLRPSPPH